MTDENEKLNDQLLADLEAYRTGEEHNASMPPDNKVLDDLENIAGMFKVSRPDPDQIPESVDNFILGHIKEKSREIRRDRKVVHLFPRYKWAAAAVMGVLVCVVSFNLFYEKDKTAEKILSNNITTVPAVLSVKKDGKDYFAVNNNQQAGIKPIGGELKHGKPGLKKVSAETYVNNFTKQKLEPMPAQSSKDIDGNGRIDIIDAYLMNRRLVSGDSISDKLDFNRDGHINNEDISTIANAAVSLQRSEG
ncbi:MAG: hypothetical protein JW927_16250 [Deltaproteobacteria bacterium]|nr:hypothetical protein [Deltaproteobacteria bacterium]